MKTKTLKKNKVNVITLGCSKNIFDSEVMMAQLRGNGMEVEHESDSLDHSVVIINTCGFIDNAKEESINTILEWSDAKGEGKVDQVMVTGCLSERYKDELQEEIPNIDAWFGTRELPRLLKTLKANYKQELVGERLLTTPAHYAYFKIAEGCDRPCSFCAIPLMRGKHVSTPIEQLVTNAKSLAAQGTKELILIAQDLTYYGLDLYGKRNLADLLRNLSDVEGIDWIRLHYAFPQGFPMDVLDVMAERSNICNYLDMPLQHISDDMLKSMRRGSSKEKTTRLIGDMRDRMPEIALRTTLIAGYPGETEAHFNEMAQWVEDTRFDRLGIFTYSHEENTHAFSLEDDVPDAEKQERANTIMEIQSGISYELNQRHVGTTQKVLFDRVEGDDFIGRTEYDSPEVDNEVIVSGSKAAESGKAPRLGDFADVKIESAEHYDLFGSLA